MIYIFELMLLVDMKKKQLIINNGYLSYRIIGSFPTKLNLILYNFYYYLWKILCNTINGFSILLINLFYEMTAKSKHDGNKQCHMEQN